MSQEFKDKVVIITGGSRGIGRACCHAFAEEGAIVVLTYHTGEDEAGQLVKELEMKGVVCLALQIDSTDYIQCQKAVAKVLEKFKKIDILISNAGITKDRALMMMTSDDWKQVVETNLGGTFNINRACITTLLKQKSGCIINMSSVSGLVGIPRQTNYSASKAGIIGFSKSLAKEVAAYNVRVNVVCPGYIDTDMLLALRDYIKKAYIESIPVKRLGKPEEVADLCLFLASDKARYITGEVIKIDGGLTA